MSSSSAVSPYVTSIKWYIRTTIKHFDMKLELAID